MTRSWREDKENADPYTQDINRHIAPHMVRWRHATEEEDRTQNKDVVWEMRSNAMRVRNYQYILNEEWRHQITIRSKRDSGAETELSKIQRGLGDLSVYAFAACASDNQVCRWVLYDIPKFAAAYAAGKVKAFPFSNRDGTHGEAYDVRLLRQYSGTSIDGLPEIVPGIIVAEWNSPEVQHLFRVQLIPKDSAYRQRMLLPQCSCGYRH